MVGRVSMDMLAIDLRRAYEAGVGGEISMGESVVLWGKGLPIEQVASQAGTINYELLCQVTGRVKRVYR